MAVIKGGRKRVDGVDVNKLYSCPLCQTQGTKRQTIKVRGGRFCKSHGQPHEILALVTANKRRRGND
jgi:hypothetical protein